MYERRLPLLAYGYYKKAGAKNKISDLHRRMIGAIGEWVGKDKIKEESLRELGLGNFRSAAPEKSGTAAMKPDGDGMIPVPVSPILREAAKKILEKP